MSDTPPLRREFAIAVALSVAVQGVVLLQLRDDPTFLTPIIDAATYHRQAIAHAAGLSPDGPFFQPPLYPMFLGVVYRVFGPSVLAAKLVQIALGAILAGLATALGGRLSGDRRVALLAGVLLTLHGPLIFFQQQLLPAGLATFLGTLAILATWRARRIRSLAVGGLAGVLWGATSLTVANSLAVVAVLAALALVRDVAARDGRAARATLALVVACAATIAPVTWHNFRTSGHFVPISTNAGINLWIGNNPEPDRTLAIRPGAEWVELQREAALAAAQKAAQEHGFSLDEILGKKSAGKTSVPKYRNPADP
ncbi:MAG: glycosyltransferase family 39 protein, partial [Gemmatimonadetes bacterium]|nr:glycosyltransferase family 39 protein [Gemmatimonadota bacterium]